METSFKKISDTEIEITEIHENKQVMTKDKLEEEKEALNERMDEIDEMLLLLEE